MIKFVFIVSGSGIHIFRRFVKVVAERSKTVYLRTYFSFELESKWFFFFNWQLFCSIVSVCVNVCKSSLRQTFLRPKYQRFQQCVIVKIKCSELRNTLYILFNFCCLSFPFSWLFSLKPIVCIYSTIACVYLHV